MHGACWLHVSAANECARGLWGMSCISAPCTACVNSAGTGQLADPDAQGLSHHRASSLVRHLKGGWCRWVFHLTLNAVNDGDLVFMHRQSEWLRQAEAGHHPADGYYMPGQSDRWAGQQSRHTAAHGHACLCCTVSPFCQQPLLDGHLLPGGALLQPASSLPGMEGRA